VFKITTIDDKNITKNKNKNILIFCLKRKNTIIFPINIIKEK